MAATVAEMLATMVPRTGPKRAPALIVSGAAGTARIFSEAGRVGG